MNAITLYFVLLKATLTSFSGGTTLPVVREELVERRAVLTDAQLSIAVAIGRIGPGPNGAMVICAGQMVAGTPGAVAGYLAMITPSFLAIGFLRLLHGRTDHPRWRGAIRGLSAAAGALMAVNALPLGREALTNPMQWGIGTVALAMFLTGRVGTVWILALAAIGGLLTAG